jgi:hypothetical protein
MKSLSFLILLVFLIPMAGFAQNFEGEIDYKITIKSRIKTMTDAQMSQAVGDESKYYISSAGNYKEVSNGGVVKWLLYLQADNKIYTDFANGRLQWVNAAIADDSVYKVGIRRNAMTILGYRCDELSMVCKSGFQLYYFSSKLRVNPALFARHHYANYAARMAQMKGAVALKYILQSNAMEVEAEAVSVKPKKLDPAFFALPPGVTPTSSPQN